MAAFLVMLREGVEAAIIVAILLAFLDKTGRRDSSANVWRGTGLAILVSIVTGVLIWNTIGSLQGESEALVEGAIALVAAGLLTWMIFWMGKQARSIRSGLEAQASSALEAGGLALAAVAFVAVVREGFESVLFLLSTTVGQDSVTSTLVGGLLGTAAAVVIGFLLYRAGHRVNLRTFFRWTGYLIILFAAGLVAKGVHEFQEIGALPTFVEQAWEFSFLDPATTTLGAYLKTMFGWDPDPSLLQVVAYWTYLISVGLRFSRMTALAKPAAVKSPAPAPG